MGRWQGRGAKEFQIVDMFNSWKEGPVFGV